MAEPVTLDEAKAQLRIIDDTSQDTLIEGYILSAREYVEEEAGEILVARTVVDAFDQFTTPLRLRSWPVAANAEVELSYIGGDGAAVDVTGARLAATSRPARLSPGAGSAWPAVTPGADVVTVTYPAGYAFPEDVPQRLKQAILLMVGHFYVNREAAAAGSAVQEVPLGVATLIRKEPVLS